MESGKIQSIAKLAAARLPRLFAEAEEEILEAIARVTSEAQHHGKEKLSFTFSHSIKLDLGKDKQEDTLSFGCRTKVGVSGAIPDPDAPEFDLGFGEEEEDGAE